MIFPKTKNNSKSVFMHKYWSPSIWGWYLKKYSMDQLYNTPLVKSRVVLVSKYCLDTLFCYQISTKKWWKLIQKAYNRGFIFRTILNWLCCIIFDPLEVFQPNLKFRLSITRNIWHNFLNNILAKFGPKIWSNLAKFGQNF